MFIKRILWYIVLLTAVLSYSAKFYDGKDEIEKLRSKEITKEELLQHIKYLSSDELEGRFPGTRGDTLTDSYIIKEFENYNLVPFGENGFLQPFEMYTQVKLKTPNDFQIVLNNNKTSYEVEKDFIPLGFSGKGRVEGNLVFAGYGINASQENYNDYKDRNGNDINIDGKILVMMRYSPGGNGPHDNPFKRYESFRVKVKIAREGKAAGIIFINGPNKNALDKLTRMYYDNVLSDAGIPVVHCKREITNNLLSENGFDLTKIQNEIDSTRTPNSFELNNVKAIIETNVEPIRAVTNNVVGFIEGQDNILKNEVIIIGAHKDHLGYGLYGSLYSGSERQIHNGADDNASGTAGVLEIAQKISDNRDKLKRSVLFICFAGEEAGLLGSVHFTNSKIFQKLNIAAMLNMDMIGRVDENKLILYGTGSSDVWNPTVENLNKNYNFKITYSSEGGGRSDHASFYKKDIPSVHFFSGTHPDYHSPTDDFEKINSGGAEAITNLIYDVVMNLNELQTKPVFTKVSEKSENRSLGNLKVYVGTIPDYSATVEGMKISGVKEGSPAEKSGLKAEDIIVKFGKIDVKNIYDYMYAMEEFKPGDEAEIIVVRNNEKVTLNVLLEGR